MEKNEFSSLADPIRCAAVYNESESNFKKKIVSFMHARFKIKRE